MTMQRVRLTSLGYLFAGLTLIASCSPTGAQKEEAGDKAGLAAESAIVRADELRLPDIPAIITEPRARAAFLIGHYWDSLDFSDTGLSLDTAFMEQNFANFISLFPHAEAQAQEAAMAALVERAKVSGEVSAFVMDIAEKYLADPNSPMRSDALYAAYARAALAGSGLSEVETARMAWLLERAEKNRPGSEAPDFAMTLADGTRTTLRAVSSHTPFTLIFFYDPDCENCKAAIAALRSSAIIGKMIEEDMLTVLAVYAEGTDSELWKEKAGLMPAAWTVGIGDGSIEDRDLYYLQALPSFYLIDSSTIHLKDATLPAIEGYLTGR